MIRSFSNGMKKFVLALIVSEVVFWIIAATFYLILQQLISNDIDQLTFKTPAYLWLLLILIPLVALMIHSINKTNKELKLIDPNLQRLILVTPTFKQQLLKFLLIRNALFFLTIALAQPVFGTKSTRANINNLELVICLDISNSMNTKDIPGNESRLIVAKRTLNQLINQLKGEKIGLVVFAGSANVQLPITNDYPAAKMFIDEIETDMISNQGTNIADALETAQELFSPEKNSKGIILVTDGENHENTPSNVIDSIKNKEIIMSIIGIGTENGGTVPIDVNRPELEDKIDETGNPVISKLNLDFIKSLTNQVNGTAIITSDPFPNISDVLTQINQMKRTKSADLQFETKQNWYQYPLFIALLFWICYLIWDFKPTTKNNLVK